jgi:hypothetical protein
MVYLKLRGSRLTLRRIAARVRQGGHDVPKQDMVRRFVRSWDNFEPVYRWRMPGPFTTIRTANLSYWREDLKAQKRRPVQSFAAGVGQALRKAAKDAAKTARMHGTPLYVWEKGRVVAKKP